MPMRGGDPVNRYDPSGLDFIEWQGDEAWWIPEVDGFWGNYNQRDKAVRIGRKANGYDGFIEIEPEFRAEGGSKFVDIDMITQHVEAGFIGHYSYNTVRASVGLTLRRAAQGSGPDQIGRIYREEARAVSNAALAGTADGFVNAAANTLTIGQAGDLRLITKGAEAVGLTVDEDSRAISQLTTRIAGELVIGIGSGGLASGSKVAQVARVLDLAQAGSDLVVGSADIAINGTNTGNVLQVAAAVVGGGGQLIGSELDVAKGSGRAVDALPISSRGVPTTHYARPIGPSPEFHLQTSHLSAPKPRPLSAAGTKMESRHVVQGAWGNANLSSATPPYARGLAPTVLLERGGGSAHDIINASQRARRMTSGGFNWSATGELGNVASDFRLAGFSDHDILSILQPQFNMLDKLGVNYIRPGGF